MGGRHAGCRHAGVVGLYQFQLLAADASLRVDFFRGHDGALPVRGAPGGAGSGEGGNNADLEGVVGGFAGRSDLHAFPGNQGNLQPIDADEIYFVVVPYKGIQLATVNQSLGLLGALVGHIHAKLVLYGHGVWVFRLVPSPAQVRQGVIDVTATYDDTAIPVWGAHSAVGHPVLTGPPKDWAMTASSHSDGYILYGAYFRKPLGNYVMQVSMTSNGPANVEAWNATSQTLLGRRIVPGTSQRTTVEVPVPNIHAYPQPLFRGHGPFTLNPIPPPDYQTVETRIWIPAGTTATVHSVRFIRRDS